MSKLALAKPSISTIQKGLVVTRNFVITKSPILLAMAATGGVVTTGVMAYRAGIKAEHILIKRESEKGESLTIEEKVTSTWKVWLPPVVSGGLTIAAIVGSTVISEKRRAALAGLYAISEAALKEYQDKAEEVVGAKKEQEIRDRVNRAAIVDGTHMPSQDLMEAGSVLVQDRLSGRVFMSSAQHIRAAACEINERIQGGDMCASLNEFYDEIGLDECELGQECGWNLDTLCKPYFTSGLTSEMRPILVLDWERGYRPKVNYRDI